MIFKRIRTLMGNGVKRVNHCQVTFSGIELLLIICILIIPMLFLPLLGFISVQSEIKVLNTEIEVLKDKQAAMEYSQRKLTDAMMNWLEAWQIDTFEASTYAPLDNKSGMCADENPFSTATGTMPHRGVIAVNFHVIPPGSVLWIPGYGWGRAEDTGGLINQRNDLIDLCMDTYEEAIQWGRRTKKVLILRSDLYSPHAKTPDYELLSEGTGL